MKFSLKFVLNDVSFNIYIGSGNALVPNRHQAITWINIDQDSWHRMVLQGYTELPDHPYPVYPLSSVNRSLSSTWKHFNYMRHLIV